MYWIREHLKVESKQSGLWVPQIIFQESLLQELFSFFKQSFNENVGHFVLLSHYTSV